MLNTHTHILTASCPGAGHVCRRCRGLHGKSLCFLQLQGEMSGNMMLNPCWTGNKPHRGAEGIYLLQGFSPGPPFSLCPPANPDGHCVGKSTSMLRQLFLCCPVFPIRTGPGKTFCSWFCIAHPVSVEFIYRKEKDTWRAHSSLQAGTNI